MTYFDACPTCEFRDSPLTCHARVVGHRAFCGDPKYRDYLREMTTGEKPAPPPAPSLLAKAVNLTRTVIGHVADRGRIAPPEVQAARRAACFSCDEYHDHVRDHCKACGCIAMDLKRSWASSSCPLPEPRWDAYRCDDDPDSPSTPPSPSNPG